MASAFDQVHLGHHVDMWDLELNHCRQCRQYSRKELARIVYEQGINEVDTTNVIIVSLQQGYNRFHHREVSVELNLSRAIDDQIVVAVIRNLIFQPIDILYQVSRGCGLQRDLLR